MQRVDNYYVCNYKYDNSYGDIQKRFLYCEYVDVINA